MIDALRRNAGTPVEVGRLAGTAVVLSLSCGGFTCPSCGSGFDGDAIPATGFTLLRYT